MSGERTTSGSPSKHVATSIHDVEVRFGLCAPRADDVERRAGGCSDNVVAALDDRRLLGGDRGDRVAEVLAVVEADCGDRRNAEVQHVGAVESAAESHLAHHRVRMSLGGDHDAGDRHELEARGLLLLRQTAGDSGDVVDDGGERVVADPRAVDDDAFAIRDEMWLGEQHRVLSRGAQNRVDNSAHRALSVGATDEHAAQIAMRIAQRLEQRYGALQTRSHAAPAHRFNRGHGAVVRGGGQRHGQDSHIASDGPGRCTMPLSTRSHAAWRAPASAASSTCVTRKRRPH
jgi:hypothetical protein